MSPTTATPLPTEAQLTTNCPLPDALFYRAGDALSFHVPTTNFAPNEILPVTPNMAPDRAKTPASWLYTSPNVRGDMPKPPLCNRLIQRRADARFGLDDRTLHPQFVVPDFEWMVCIPRRSLAPSDLQILWWTPTKADAPAVQGNTLVYQVRVFRSSKIADLKAALRKCEVHASSTIRSHPKATLISLKIVHAAHCLEQVSVFGMEFRDLLQTLTDFQKACLDVLALTHYLDVCWPRLLPTSFGDNDPYPVDMSLMGGWTRDLGFAQALWRMGIPVWVVRPHWALNIRDMKIYDDGKKAILVHDERIVLTQYQESDAEPHPFPVLYHGLPCTDMHNLMQNLGYSVVDISLSSQRGWDRLTGATTQTTVSVFALPPETTVPSTQTSVASTTSTIDSSPIPTTSATPGSPGDPSKFLHCITSGVRPPLNPEDETPPQIPVWLAAIEAINTTKAPATKKNPFVGFRLPPPSIFMRPKTRRGRVLYLATWLATRSVHMSNILNGTISLNITFQNWRHHLFEIANHLQPDGAAEDGTGSSSSAPAPTPSPTPPVPLSGTDLPVQPSASIPSEPLPTCPRPDPIPPSRRSTVQGHPPSKTPSRAPARPSLKRPLIVLEEVGLPQPPKRKSKQRVKANAYLDGLDVRDNPVASVHWIKKTALIGSAQALEESLAPRITAEVIWEVQENCFRLDLLALDQALAPRKWPAAETDEARAARLKRSKEVREVFPSKMGTSGIVSDTFIVSQIPNVDRALAAYDYFGRHPAVRALRDLMIGWKGCPDTIRNASLGFHRRHADELEALVVPFYCQAFYNTFGRMPVPPPRLPFLSTTRQEPVSVSAASFNQV